MRSDVLWTWEQLCQVFAPAQESARDKNLSITGIAIDSRSTQPGDLFIALSSNPGPRFGGTPLLSKEVLPKEMRPKEARDGHDFLEAAIKAGAKAVMVDREVHSAVPMLSVSDTLEGLWQLAQAARTRNQGRIIALTGSSGKTTLRFWLETILRTLLTSSARHRVHASRESLNNHWGVPLSLCRMPAHADYSLFEIGTNHPGEMQPLAELVSPDLALVLNILPAHIGNFASMLALREEKLSITRGLKPGGTLILPWDLGPACHKKIAQEGYQVLSFGTDPRADVHGTISTQQTTHLDNGAVIQAKVLGQELELEIPFVGRHRLESVLASLAVLAVLELDLPEALAGFRLLQLPPGRGKQIQLGAITLIDDSYNANPVSMRLALEALEGSREAGRKIALLGEMHELGETGAAAHREIAKHCGAMDLVLTFGAGFQELAMGSAHQAHYDRVEDFDLGAFIAELQPGDQILVKGSNRVFWKNNFVGALRAALAT